MVLDTNPFPTGYGTQASGQVNPDYLKPAPYAGGGPAGISNMVKALMDGYDQYLTKHPAGAAEGPKAGQPLNIQSPQQQAGAWPGPVSPVPYGGMGFMDLMKGAGMPTGGFMDFLNPKPVQGVMPTDPNNPNMSPVASTNPVGNALFSPVPMSSQNAIY